MNKLKELWIALKSKFITYHKLHVSYNAYFGDEDDREFVVKKFLTKKEKHLKFITSDGKTVEIQGVEGLNYRIEEL